LILAIQLPLLVLLVVIGRPLLEWLGPEFAAGYQAMVMLAAAEAIQGAFGVSDLILLYRRPTLALAVTCTSAAVNFAGGWLLVSALGIDGAALAVLLAWIAGALVRRVALSRVLGLRLPLWHSAGPIAAAVLASLAAMAILSWSGSSDSARHLLAMTIALAAYASGLWLWHKATGESLRLTGFRAARPGT
jgi:hypothetical protein